MDRFPDGEFSEPLSRRRLLGAMATATGLGVAGCVTSPGGRRAATPTQALLPPDSRYGYTHVQPTGNRVLQGSSDIRTAGAVDVRTTDRPVWLCALPGEDGSLWTVVTGGGGARTVRVSDGRAEAVATYNPLPDGTPPLTRLRQSGAGVGLVRPPSDGAQLTHPVVTERGPLYVAENGDLVFEATESDDPLRFDVGALPDGRIVHVDSNRYALLGDQTRRYQHGALGDSIEGGSLVVFDAAAGEVVTRERVGPPAVVEGVSPMVADVDGTGAPDIVVTLADSDNGAWLAVYRPDGTKRSEGPIHGPGWRHQLAVAPFAPDGSAEIAAVLKPHVNQVLEFYRLQRGSLEVVAELDGYSTHTYGSHNPDGAVAGDLDDDGQVELLLPTSSRDQLRAVRRTGSGARVDWELDPGGVVRSNLTGVTLGDGRVAVGVGTDAGVRVWQG